MFLKHGSKNLNQIDMVAPTGFGSGTCSRFSRLKA
jgi:hypothetical protein